MTLPNPVPPPPPPALKILCFGNSLTAGYSRYGLAYFPYADTLEPTLRKLVPSLEKANLVIDTDGLPGDRVMRPQGRCLERLQERVLKNRGEGAYDWIVILSGTNDLGWGSQAEEIFEALSESVVSCNFPMLSFSFLCELSIHTSVYLSTCIYIYTRRYLWRKNPEPRRKSFLPPSHSRTTPPPHLTTSSLLSIEALYTLALTSSPHTKILALTIPECAANFPSLMARRKNLNDLIAAHTSPRFHVCDLCSAIPYFAMDIEERKKVWDDGLHLKEEGYRRMGEVVGARMAEILTSEVERGEGGS